MTDETTLYCAIHPNIETSLRCNRCDKPICSKCAIHTPTGYRCRECVHNQQKIFNTANWYDYLLGFLIATGLSYLGSLIAPKMGFFVLFLAPLVGMIIAEGVRFVTQRRRSKQLFITIAVGALIGSLPVLVFQIISLIMFLAQIDFTFNLLFSTLWHGAYAVMVTSTVYYRISGLAFNR